MNKISFSAIFKGNYLQYVTKYKENIQVLLSKYDVVIFMARKAICFYESMVTNGEIKKTNCEVFSSRIVDYNIIQRIRDKKIAIVDDVVVKGTSLNRVINLLNKENIKAFVLVVACDSSFLASLIKNKNFEMCDSYVTFGQADIYSFAGMITEYIDASMCPFNIDQPIYTISNISKLCLNRLFIDYKSIEISSDLQQTYGIENRVIYFRKLKSDDATAMFNLIPDETILKIRIMSTKSKVLVIPFVLFSQLKNYELDELYSVISNDFLEEFVCVDNVNITQENKMKVVSYYFSEILARVFFGIEKIEYEKVFDNDIFHFSINTNRLFNSENISIDLNKEALCIDNVSVRFYSKFILSNVIGICYNSIIEANTNDIFFDSNNKVIDEIIITHDYFRNKISDFFDSPELLASSVIDIFIDRGMMVPTIVHFDSGIVRAYKMGEYSKLTRSQIEVFAAMLFQYQESINNELGKTELEKLCVLFFNTAINRGVFPQQSRYEDDCYSICYSLFGPRVSLSNTIYNASTDSVLVTDFCQKKKGKSIITYKNGKYKINPFYTSLRMSNFALGFAHLYAAVYKVFNNIDSGHTATRNWNMFVHTYIQYLTLRAIGNNKRSQYLSLCAELYQLSKLKDDFFKLKDKERKECEWILKGINSGLWKYWCFKNNALYKTTMLIYEMNHDVGAWLLSDVESASDESDTWNVLIKEAARLLYKTAFLINEVLKVKNCLDYFDTRDDVCENDSDSSLKKTMFTIGSYYAEFKEIRHYYENTVREYTQSAPSLFYEWASKNLIELKAAARHQLDLCDQILEHSTAKYDSIQKLLVVYSPTASFPINISDGLNELYFEGIEQNKFCKVFGLSMKKSNIADLTNLLDRINLSTNEYDLKYFVFDVGEGNSINSIENKVKDRYMAQILNCTIDSFCKIQSNNKPELILVGPNHYDTSFKYRNHHFTLSDDSTHEMIEKKLKNSSCSFAGQQFSVNIFIIQENTMNFEGENTMKINKVNHIENLIEQNGDNSTSTIVHGDYNAIPKEMVELLQKLITKADNSEKIHIEKAIKYAKYNDKSKFLKTIKTLGAHTLSIIENIAGSIIYEWLHQNGIF